MTARMDENDAEGRKCIYDMQIFRTLCTLKCINIQKVKKISGSDKKRLNKYSKRGGKHGNMETGGGL